MTPSRASGHAVHWTGLGSALASVALALAFTLFGASANAAITKDTTLSKEDQVCLDCHAKPNQEKVLKNGEKLSLVISPKGFAQSVHNSSGCEGCHSDVDLADHGKQPKSIASKREHSVGLMETCRDCHKKTVKQYEDSVHSAMVRSGSDKAPLCADCHNPHTTRSVKDRPEGHNEPVACQQCHQGIATAFAASVHGSSGDEALVCKDCHQTHNVKAAAFGDHMRGQCLSCHRDTVTTHATWLPNTERHLEAISCPACHSPGTTRRVNLRLYEGNAPRQSTEQVGVPRFVKVANWADATSAGLDARALWSMLQEFNNGSSESKTALRGRLEVQTGVQAHQLALKALAVKECDTCHRQGAASFQSVSISIAGPDGRPLRHEASQGMLTSVESIGSVGGFYAIGSTRIKVLDYLLLLAVVGGVLLPSAHLAMKLISRRQRTHGVHDADSSARQSAETPESRK